MTRLYLAAVVVTVATGAVFSVAYPAARLGVAWWTVGAIIVMAGLVVAICAMPCESAAVTRGADDDGDGGWLPGDDGPVAPQPLPGRGAALDVVGAVDWAAEVDAMWARVGDRVEASS